MPQLNWKRTGLMIAALALAALACNLPGQGGAVTEEPVATDAGVTFVPPTDAPAGSPTDEPAAVPTAAPTDAPAGPAGCPTPGAGETLYISEAAGFCLLYPAAYTLNEYNRFPGAVMGAYGPPLDPASMEPIGVSFSVERNGPADGLNAGAYAALYQERFMAGMPPSPIEAVTVGGQPAAVLHNIPGMISQQAAFVIANGNRYAITMLPQFGDIPGLDAEAAATWALVTGSIAFFPPSVTPPYVRAEDVCPSPDMAIEVNINYVDGVCMHYPSDFTIMDAFPSGFQGGPVLGEWSGMDIISNLVVGTRGPAGGESPLDILGPAMDTVDPATVVSTTIGGAPAVTYTSIAGPWPARHAIIVANGTVYTIVNQPYDFTTYPEAEPWVERVWNIVTASMTFFTPWR
jgi:hypothetical protein